MIKLVVFDLDGTLCDTITDIATSLNRVLVLHEIPPYTREQVRSMVGRSMVYMCQRAMPRGRENDWKPVMEDYFKVYSRHLCDTTAPYPGIPEMLETLRRAGLMVACVSNKPHANTVYMLSHLFEKNGAVFNQVQGQNSKFALKPHPDSLSFVIENLGCTPEETLYVGDMDVDMQFARNTGTHFCGVAWGFKGRKVLESLGSEFVIDTPDQLFDVLDYLNGIDR